MTTRLFALVLAIVLILPLPLAAQTRIPGEVVRVVDGDTIHVQLDSGQRETVRLLLIDTPETVHPSRPVECFGREASNHAKSMLLGKRVELELDVQQRDRYQRLLAYVWLDGALVNVQLVAEGYAVPLTIPPNVRYVDQVREAARIAREEQRGLWSACQEQPAATDIEPTSEDVPAPAGNCDPSYPTVCIPPAPPDLDCPDIPHRRFTVLPPDPHRFDGDRDGVGCET